MAEIFEVTPECADSVQSFVNELKEANKGYQVKHPKIKAIVVAVGSASAWYVIDSILCSVTPIPMKFPVMAAKIMRRIGITVLGGLVTNEARKYVCSEYDHDEETFCETVDKIKNAIKEGESDGENEGDSEPAAD